MHFLNDVILSVCWDGFKKDNTLTFSISERWQSKIYETKLLSQTRSEVKAINNTYTRVSIRINHGVNLRRQNSRERRVGVKVKAVWLYEKNERSCRGDAEPHVAFMSDAWSAKKLIPQTRRFIAAWLLANEDIFPRLIAKLTSGNVTSPIIIVRGNARVYAPSAAPSASASRSRNLPASKIFTQLNAP